MKTNKLFADFIHSSVIFKIFAGILAVYILIELAKYGYDFGRWLQSAL